MATSLTLDALERRIGAVRAVDGVTLTIEPGEVFFLLGPSGCGKTTTLRLIAGFIEPTSGRILFGDRDVTGLPPRARRAAMVFQSYALWPHMTVRGNVAFGLGSRKLPRDERRRRAHAALRAVRMEGLADRKPAQLSGGQQQRVALARALAVEPDVMLLDEPLSNLDARLRREMRREIRRLCTQAGSTTVYVTHDQAEALSMADRIGVMRDGRLEQVGPPAEVYRRPVNRFVAEFLGEANLLPATVAGRDTGRVILDTPAGRLAATPTGATPAVGTRALACIRPETLTRADGPAGTANNILTTVIKEYVYLGASAALGLRAGDADLRATAFAPTGRPPAPGEPWPVAIDPDHIALLPAEN